MQQVTERTYKDLGSTYGNGRIQWIRERNFFQRCKKKINKFINKRNQYKVLKVKRNQARDLGVTRGRNN